MHRAFYKFNCEPFDTQPDPSFLWLGEKHKEALSILRYGILDNKGFLLLTGEGGTGKTTLLNSLVEGLTDDILWALIPDPNLARMDFFNAIASGFGMKKKFAAKVEFMLEFGVFLQKAHDDQKKVLLIIDEAHLLSQETLEEIRLLANIENVDTKLINIFFVGQPQFKSFLARPRNTALRQRLTLTYNIEPLSAPETADYIQHRFSVAGVDGRVLTEKAIKAIHQYSGGVPRKINVICHQVLVESAVQGRKVVDQGVIHECMRKFEYSDNPNRHEFAGNHGKRKFFSGAKKQQIGVALALVAVVVLGGGGYLGYGYLQRFLAGDGQPAVEQVVDAKDPAVPATENSQPVAGDSGTTAEVTVGASDDQVATQPEAESAQPEATGVGSDDKGMAKTAAEADDASSGANPVIEIVTRQNIPAPDQTASQTVAAVKDAVPAAEPTAPAAEPQQDEVDSLAKDVPAEAAPAVTGAESAAVAETKPVENETIAPPPIAKARIEKAILPLQANSLKLTPPAQKDLEKFVAALVLYPGATVEVRGYVSAKDNSEENIKLSLSRAEAVKKLLLAKGVKEEKISVKGMGNQDPLGDNATSAGRSKNRRVEIEVLHQ